MQGGGADPDPMILVGSRSVLYKVHFGLKTRIQSKIFGTIYRISYYTTKQFYII